MINKFVQSACALTLLIAFPAVTLAAPRDNGRGGGGARPAAPAARQAAPAARPAPAAPRARTAPAVNSGGFNFNHDINARPAPVVQRPAPAAPPQRRAAPPQRPAAPAYRPANHPHAPNTNSSGGPYRGRFVGPVVRNAHAPSGNWGWNHGVAWRPAPVYWGGGFWGAFALASLTNALLFGSIVDDQEQLDYPSYQIQPDTPGAELLEDYQLQQTPCGPPNLVVIWGPDNSVICALPNDTVGPGNYQVDPSTFTLVPAQ